VGLRGCPIRVLDGFCGFFGLRFSQSGYFDAEAIFDELGVCDRQSVLGRQASTDPIGCLVARLQTAQFGERRSRSCRDGSAARMGGRTRVTGAWRRELPDASLA
jgi:hypothetical protein